MTYILPDNKLSPSRISAYSRCPACFAYQYIDKQPVRIHISLPRGVAVHAGVHAARKQVMAGDAVAVDDCVAVAHDSLKAELKHADPALLDLGSTGYAKGEDAAPDVRTFTETAIKQAVLARDARVGIVEVEARVDYSAIFPFDFEAYLDVLLVGGIFPDLKTSSGAWPPDWMAFTQLRLYSLPWYLEGQPIGGLVIDQVRLPTPRKPAMVHFFEASAEPEHYEATRKFVLDVAAGISTGVFPPRPNQFCKMEHSLAA